MRANTVIVISLLLPLLLVLALVLLLPPRLLVLTAVVIDGRSRNDDRLEQLQDACGSDTGNMGLPLGCSLHLLAHAVGIAVIVHHHRACFVGLDAGCL